MDSTPPQVIKNGKPVLLLRLEGPLQSWGIRSRWDVRDTAPAPTKSGLIGLLGCALGYERGDARLRELDGALRLGVRVEYPGRIVTDYQTITDYLPTAGGEWKLAGSKTSSSVARARESGALPATIISPRSYLENAAFLAAFEARDGNNELLEKCAAALQSPKWPLFLGRKSCVATRPIFDAKSDGLQLEYSGVEDALRHHHWDFRGSKRQLDEIKRKPNPLRIYIEESNAGQGASHSWQDALLPGSARLYGFRAVRQDWVPFNDLRPQAEYSAKQIEGGAS